MLFVHEKKIVTRSLFMTMAKLIVILSITSTSKVRKLHLPAENSKILSPAEKRFDTAVPTKYNPTETLKTSSQEPDNNQRECEVSDFCC